MVTFVEVKSDTDKFPGPNDGIRITIRNQC